MNKIILSLLSKRTTIDGQDYLIPPVKGLKRKIFNFFSRRAYEKKHKHIEKLEITELKNVLKQTVRLFKDKNHLYQIDINHTDWTEIQIIHPFMIKDQLTENENYDNFGFVVYWVFDSMKETNIELIKRINNIDNLSRHIHFKQEKTIDCFAFYCGDDVNKAYEITKTMLNEICGYDSKNKYRYSISDNGMKSENNA